MPRQAMVMSFTCAMLAACDPAAMQLRARGLVRSALRAEASDVMACPPGALAVEDGSVPGRYRVSGCGDVHDFVCEITSMTTVECELDVAAELRDTGHDGAAAVTPGQVAVQTDADAGLAEQRSGDDAGLHAQRPDRLPMSADATEDPPPCYYRSCGSGLLARHSLGLSLGSTVRDDGRTDVWLLSPRVYGSYRMGPAWGLELDWGGAVRIERGAGMLLAVGNPYVGARVRIIDGDRARLSVGGGVTAPLARVGEGPQAGQRRAALGLAAALRGLWDPWLWGPSQAGIASGALLTYRASRGLGLLVEGDLGSTLSVGDATGDIGDLFAQLAVEGSQLGYHGVGVGWRLQGVWMTADRDRRQLSVAPFIFVPLGTLELRAQWVLNLDEPLGFLDSGLDVWGALVSVEVAR